MRIARSRKLGSRYLSHVSAGSRTWPSASITLCVGSFVMVASFRVFPRLAPRRLYTQSLLYLEDGAATTLTQPAGDTRPMRGRGTRGSSLQPQFPLDRCPRRPPL